MRKILKALWGDKVSMLTMGVVIVIAALVEICAYRLFGWSHLIDYLVGG
jgi:hypothetical protein